MLIFLVLLSLITPFLVLRPFGEEVVMPKLVATAVLVGLALLWSAVVLLRDRWPAGRSPPAIWAALGVFAIVNVLALLLAEDPRSSVLGEYQRYQGLATTLLYVLLFVVAAFAVRTTKDLTWLLLALAIAAFGTSVYALIQKAGFDWADLTGRDPDRPGSTVGQANNFGLFLVVVMSACVFLFFVFRERWQQALLGAGFLVMLLALFFTASQSAYLAAGGAWLLWCAIFIAWFSRRFDDPNDRQAVRIGGATAALAPLVIAGLVILLVGLPGRESVNEAFDDSESIQGRLTFWKLGLEMTADRPLLGYGQDAFSIQFPSYRDRPDLPGINTKSIDPESAHNFYVDLLAGTGVLGFASFMALVGVIAWYGVQRVRRTDDVMLRVAIAALGIALLAQLGALFFGFAEAMTTWLFWLLLGSLAGLLAEIRGPAAEDGEGTELGGLAAGFGAMCLAALGAVALGWGVTLTAAEVSSDRADTARREGRFDDAERLIDRAIMLNPLSKEYMLQKAEMLERGARLEAAIEAYEDLGNRFPPTAFGVLSQGLLRIQLIQENQDQPVETAFPLLERALELDPYNEEFRIFIADKYEELGFEQEALAHRYELLYWRGQQED